MTDSSIKKLVNKNVHSYIANYLNPFIQPLVTQLVKKRPADPLNFSINWLTQRDKKQKYRSRKVIESDTDEECKDQVRQLSSRIQKKKHTIRRLGEEPFSQYNDRAQLEMTQQDVLSKRDKDLVRSFMKNSILFQNLDTKDQEIIMKAMIVREVQEYEMIIKEGQLGNHFFIVSSGDYDCYKVDSQGHNAFVKKYKAGESFGELALMYNSFRAASIIANSNGRLLCLDKSIFSHILKVAALRKQIIIKDAIEKVQILKQISKDHMYHLINILKQEKFNEGDYVIKEGQNGDKFYIVLEGKLTAQKTKDEKLQTVWQFSEGDYFGELALINNEPRQASIKAVSTSKLALISRNDFKRVFQQIEQSLRLKTSKYQECQL